MYDKQMINDYIAQIGRPTLLTLLAKYQQKSEGYVEDLQTVIAEEVNEKWRRQCHSFRSAAASLGLTQVVELTRHLEQCLVATEREAGVVTLSSVNQQSIQALQHYLDDV